MRHFFKFRLSLRNTLISLALFLFSFVVFEQRGGSSQWFTIANLPFSSEFHVTVGWKHQDTNFIIIAGGRYNDTTSNRVLLFNTKSSQYRPLMPLPMRIERAGGFILGDSLYIVGGAFGPQNNFSNKLLKKCLTDTSAWTTRADFPIPIGEITYSTAARNDTLAYVAGGSNGTVPISQVYYYDARRNIWSQGTSLPVQGAAGGSMCFLRDTVMLFVGGKMPGGISNQTFRGRISSQAGGITWSTGPNYPEGGIYYTGTWGAKNGNAFFTGGSNMFDNMGGPIDGTYQYNDSTGYDTLSDKPTPVSHVQIYGFILPPSPGNEITYEVYAPGGSSDNNDNSSLNVHEKLVVVDSVVSSINLIGSEIPEGFQLAQNYPNPFNPVTNIRFSVPVKGLVMLTVYNLSGKVVSMPVNKILAPGIYEASFNALNLPSGVYFYKLESGGFKDVKKMLLVK